MPTWTHIGAQVCPCAQQDSGRGGPPPALTYVSGDVVVLRWHADGFGEDGGELVEERRQEVVAETNLQGRTRRTGDSLPTNLVVVAPKRQGESIEVPQNRAQGAEPLCAQDHVIAGQKKREEVDGEDLVINGQVCGAVDAGARDALTIGHRDLQVPRSWREVRLATSSETKLCVDPESRSARSLVPPRKT